MLDRIDHVGVIVDDLEVAKRFLGDVLKLELIRELSLPEQRIQAAFYRCGDASVEVIQVDDPAERARRLGDGATARIEHIAFEVDRLEPTLEELRAAGVQTVTEQPRRIGPSRTIFTRPDSTNGVVLQFLDRHAPG
jgi:methylmalonyl-CoA epimerase